MSIQANIEAVNSSLQKGVKLVAVSKTKPASFIQEAYDSGQRIFGENRPQEMKEKANALPTDIEWHMIGHLQSNKVKYIAPFVSLVHSVDKLSLLQEINKRAAQHERTIDVLLQVYIAKEESKHGMDEEEVIELLNSKEFQELKNIRVIELMGMATNTKDETFIKKEFNSLKIFFDKLQDFDYAQSDNSDTQFDSISLTTLSMGMSGDYHIAMAEGSTMVRVGSAIFGSRG